MTSISSISGFSQNRPDPAEMKATIISQLESAGATDEEISSVSSSNATIEDIKELASKYGVTLPEPPQQSEDGQEGIFNGEMGAAPSGPPQEIVSALQAGGATDEQIAALTGPEDTQALAAELGVTLPEPPAPPTEGAQFNAIA